MSQDSKSSSAPGSDLEDAIHHLEQAVRLSPGNPRYAALLGEAWLLNGDPEAALAPLQASIQGEFHPRVASLLAVSLLKLDRFSDAESFATAALEETSAFHRAWFIRAEARIAQRNPEGGIEDLRRAVKLAPGNETYCLRLASLLIEGQFQSTNGRDRLNEARTLLESVEQPAEDVAWRYLRGCVLLELEEPKAALVAFDGLEWPTACEVALRRGYAHLGLGDKAEALLAFRLARVDELLTDIADRMIERIELGPDHEAPTARAAPVTQVITGTRAATALLSTAPENEDASDELELLDDLTGSNKRAQLTEEFERLDLDGEDDRGS